MAVNKDGQIIDEQGTPTGGQVNLQTGVLETPPSTPISADKLTSRPPVTVPPVDDGTNPSDVTQSLPTTAFDADVEAARDTVTSDIEAIKNKYEELDSEGAYTQEQINKQGISEKERDVLQYTSQLKQMQIEDARANARALTQRGVDTTFAHGEAALIARERAFATMAVSASLEAAQGNLALAQNQVDRAVALKYDPIEKDIDRKLKILELNRANLSDKEGQRADELAFKLENLKTDNKLEAENMRSFQNQKITAINKGMPSAVARQADALFKAGDSNGAYDLMAKYTKDNPLSEMIPTDDLATLAEQYGLSEIPPPGTTYAQLNDMAAAQRAPHAWSPQELTSAVRGAQEDGDSATTAFEDIKNNPAISNKEDAYLIVESVYGVKRPKAYRVSSSGQSSTSPYATQGQFGAQDLGLAAARAEIGFVKGAQWVNGKWVSAVESISDFFIN